MSINRAASNQPYEVKGTVRLADGSPAAGLKVSAFCTRTRQRGQVSTLDSANFFDTFGRAISKDEAMARPLRIEYPGAFYHVTSRGNEQKDVFKSQKDRERFLSYVESAVVRYGAVVHTWCLMRNHYHLLLETPSGNLSQMIRRDTSYEFARARLETGHAR